MLAEFSQDLIGWISQLPLLGFGWIVHENRQVIGRYLGVYSRIILSGILLFVAIRVGLHHYRKHKMSSGSM